MESNQELKEFFESELVSGLEGLESVRKNIKGWYMSCIAYVVAPVAGIGGFAWLGDLPAYIDRNPSSMFLIVGAPILCLIALVITIYSTGKKATKYRSRYKEEVVSKLVAHINPEWRYEPDQFISREDYHRSAIFKQTPDRYKGDDLVEGVVEKTHFVFSELHTEYKRQTRDSDGNRKTEWVTIFKGLFAHIDFNKDIKGETYVVPDFAEKLLGKFGQKLQGFSSHGKLIKLENPEFEKQFAVYGSDQIEPRYILTPTMMEAMVRIKKKYRKNIAFAFKGSRVYMAMSFFEDLFEPKIARSGLKFKDIETMADLFRIIETIIHEMNLNTRIWTKQ